MAYSDRKTIVTIVDEHRVEDVITAINQFTESGTSSAGIIVISSVDEHFADLRCAAQIPYICHIFLYFPFNKAILTKREKITNNKKVCCKLYDCLLATIV